MYIENNNFHLILFFFFLNFGSQHILCTLSSGTHNHDVFSSPFHRYVFHASNTQSRNVSSKNMVKRIHNLGRVRGFIFFLTF